MCVIWSNSISKGVVRCSKVSSYVRNMDQQRRCSLYINLLITSFGGGEVVVSDTCAMEGRQGIYIRMSRRVFAR